MDDDPTEAERVALARRRQTDRLAWLRAMVDEDERLARVAAEHPELVTYAYAHTPAREPAEVAFKRSILDAADVAFTYPEPRDEQGRYLSHPIARLWFRKILTEMAALYASLGRLGYREDLWPW